MERRVDRRLVVLSGAVLHDLAWQKEIKLVTIDDPIFGGWAKAQPYHFGDGGIFDQIYKPAQ